MSRWPTLARQLGCAGLREPSYFERFLDREAFKLFDYPRRATMSMGRYVRGLR